ncbi:MAG: hypothetical protein ACRC8S_11035 [Fimbriiglobus sp.]
MRWLFGLLAVSGLGILQPGFAQSRFEKFTKQFADTPDQAKVLAAGPLGSSGTEWLSGGGFQPDGTVVVVGVTLGPSFDLGVSTKVLGTDASAPGVYQPEPQLNAKGLPETGKDGTPKYKLPAWTHSSATGFIARMSPDLKMVKSVSRLPWRSAGITSAAVDSSGNIYITGPASSSLGKLSADTKALTPSTGNSGKGATERTYLAKLNSDASQVLWVRTLDSKSNAPNVDIDSQGNIRFQSTDLRTLNSDGKELDIIVVPDTLGKATAVNLKDGTYARGGETRNWATGREPYRDPYLYIHEPSGKLKYELYHWDGPLVGVDSLRLVSDSAIRLMKYDDEGHLLMYAWSDGGNSVMYREPFDVRTFAPGFKGIGMSAYGANVLSCTYIIKLDPKSWKVIGGTLWLAYLTEKDKPNTTTVNTLGVASDGSVVIGGDSAYGLIQTGNHLNSGDPRGNYIALFNKDCTSLRFCSGIPTAGRADIADGGRWAFVKGTVGGKPLLLALGSAGESETHGEGKKLTTPLKNLTSKPHSGGLTDGYMLLLDLSAK